MSYLLTRKNVWQKLESSSLPLGIIEDGQTAPSTQITLEHRDIFLSFTDGVVEAVSPAGAQFGIDRALEIVIANRNLPAEEIVNAVYAAINDFCCGAAPVDDITIVVLKRDRAGDEPDAAEQSRQNRSPHRKRHR
jgi:sigma-B regulation protein RsbU (phosphoserine phosphatase)